MGADRADSLFYSINPGGPSIRLNKISIKGREGMISTASATGGAAFLPDGNEALDRVSRQIAAELQAQYLLGYYATDGGLLIGVGGASLCRTESIFELFHWR
jgi:hypothetical protein